LLIFVSQYVSNYLGAEFVKPLPFALEETFEDSSPITPIIFVLSPGSDPMNYLVDLAKKMGKFPFSSISLG
jgi:dynein heavy chain